MLFIVAAFLPLQIGKESRKAPLYKATERLLWEVDDTLNYLCKDRRHTLGQHMLQIVLGMMDCISIAYDFPEQRAEQLKMFLPNTFG